MADEIQFNIWDPEFRANPYPYYGPLLAGPPSILTFGPMTFALVADKLGISRSAAKERAERAYKKLGVHNRADAVARARELGLIRHVA